MNDQIKNILFKMGCEEFNLNSKIEEMKEKTKIIFNGNWIGFAADP
jgi:hypothetical protein